MKARARLMVVALGAVLAATAWVVRHPSAEREPQIPSYVVILPNGVPIEAPSGSAERELIDWLSLPGSGERHVDLGSLQFEPHSAIPTLVFRQRIKRLASILTAFDNVDIRLLGRAHKAGVLEASFTADRIAWFIGAMREADVQRSRLDSEIRAAKAKPWTPEAVDTGQFALVLRKRD